MLTAKERTKFLEAYYAYGRNTGLARLFGVSRAAVSQWKSLGGFPAKRALQIEVDSKGKFRAVDIVDQAELALE